MTDADEKLLEDNGWEVECRSPFEIQSKEDPQSRATGWAAEIVLESIRCDQAPSTVSKEEFEAIYIERSDFTREFYDKHFVTLPCDCGEEMCVGWQCLSRHNHILKKLNGDSKESRPHE